MRFAAILAILPTVALGVTVETLPRSEYADTEVSTNIPFEVSFDAMSRMNFSISLEASPSNCVEVSIGEDANGDCVLSLDETDQTFGYNSGHWFQRDATREMFECSEISTDRRSLCEAKSLEWCSIVRLNGTERTEKTFVLKKRKLDETWNLVKVTRRGKAEVCELTMVEGAKPGAALIVR